MPKKTTKIEIILEGDGRFLLKVYADGSEERVPIVKLPRKPPRFRYRTVTLDKIRKRDFELVFRDVVGCIITKGARSGAGLLVGSPRPEKPYLTTKGTG
jgi:hypothetical protein